MSNKEKLLKVLKKELSPNNRDLLKVFTIVEQKDFVIFRTPAAFFTLDTLWDDICIIAEKNNIPVSRVDLYATVEELDNILTSIEWLWKSNIPKGFMTLVAGEPGIGKSLFVLDLAKIVTKGMRFPNSQDHCDKGSVLWIDTEMKQQLLNVRSKSLGLDRSKLYIPSIGGNLLTKFDASDPEHIKHVVAIIEDKKPMLMVIDSLGHSHSKGENRIEEVRPVMDFLSGVARNYNMAVIVVHHLNKGSPGESPEISLARVRGSTDIVATPVVIYALEKSSAEDSIKIRQIKNNIGKPQPILNAKLEYQDNDKEEIKSLLYTMYIPPPPKKTKKETCAEWIYGKIYGVETGVLLQQLIEEGEGVGYTRGNIYAAREVLGDKLTFGGTGKKSIWYLTQNNDSDAIGIIAKANGCGKSKSS